MKWACLMANMVIPGVGTLFIKRWTVGMIQTVLSLIAWGLFIPGLLIGIEIISKLTKMNKQALDENFEQLGIEPEKMGSLVMDNIPMLALGIVGLILLKITLIWSQINVSKHFKALNEAEAAAEAQAAQTVPPPVDSSN